MTTASAGQDGAQLPPESGDGPVTRQEVDRRLQRLQELGTQQVDAERRARESALIAQEHRLIPAIRNAIDSIFKPEHKNDRSPAFVALAWWFFRPSAGRAALLAGVLTVVFTAMQVALLHQQNARLDVQNALAEGQRRAGLMAEFDSILVSLAREQEAAPSCDGPASSERCWRSVTEVEGVSLPDGAVYRAFWPSTGTTARLASLTQALRPYYQLAVGEEQVESCDPARSGAAHPLRRFGTNFLAGTVPARMSEADGTRLVHQIAVSAAAASWNQTIAVGWLARIGQWLEETGEALLRLSKTGAAELSCRALSPERARVFAAMVAAQVDLEALDRANASFVRADFTGMSFDGRILVSVNLRGASFRRSGLVNTMFVRVDLPEADFAEANLAGAKIIRSDLRASTFPLSAAMPEGFGSAEAQARNAAQFWDNRVQGLIIERRTDDGSEVMGGVPEGERLIDLAFCTAIADPAAASRLRRVPLFLSLVDDPKGAIAQELTYEDEILVSVALSFVRLDHPLGRDPIWSSDPNSPRRRFVFVTHAAECPESPEARR